MRISQYEQSVRLTDKLDAEAKSHGYKSTLEYIDAEIARYETELKMLMQKGAKNYGF